MIKEHTLKWLREALVCVCGGGKWRLERGRGLWREGDGSFLGDKEEVKAKKRRRRRILYLSWKQGRKEGREEKRRKA